MAEVIAKGAGAEIERVPNKKRVATAKELQEFLEAVRQAVKIADNSYERDMLGGHR